MSHDTDDARVFHQFCRAGEQAGYSVHLFASQEVAVDGFGVTIHPVPKAPSRLKRWLSSYQLARTAMRLNPSVLHVHEPLLLAPAVRMSRGRAKIVWDVHEDYLQVALTRHWIPKPLRTSVAAWWKFSELRSLKKVDAVVVANPPHLERYAQLHSRALVMPNFPELRPFETRTPSSHPIAIYTGTILPNRGLWEAVEALSIARKEGVDVQLLVAGGVPEDGYFDTVLDHASQLGVRDLVDFRGRVPRDEALALQRTATIGLIPHLPVGNNLHAWSVKMVEFMEAGLPVVYSDIPAHREIAQDDSIGISVNPTRPAEIAAALIQLSKNPDLAEAMGKAGRQVVVDRLSWDSKKSTLIDLYDSLALGVEAARTQENADVH